MEWWHWFLFRIFLFYDFSLMHLVSEINTNASTCCLSIVEHQNQSTIHFFSIWHHPSSRSRVNANIFVGAFLFRIKTIIPFLKLKIFFSNKLFGIGFINWYYKIFMSFEQLWYIPSICLFVRWETLQHRQSEWEIRFFFLFFVCSRRCKNHGYALDKIHAM